VSPRRSSSLRNAQGLVLAGALSLAACGGGGSGAGEDSFGEGSGTGGFGTGAGAPPFGPGSGSGGLTGDGVRPAADPAVVISNADLQGSVIDARSGVGLSGASVRFGTTTVTAGGEGRYEQDPVAPTPRLVLEGSATGYETLHVPTEVLGSVPSVNLLRLTAYGTTADITVASGGTVTDATTSAAITVPVNGLSAAGGGQAPATVGLRVTAIAAATDPHLISGDYTDSQGNRLETFGAVVISASAAVDVTIGQSLSLSIPRSTRSTAAAGSANLYWFDAASGVWVQDGTASGSGSTYTAAVTRFGQWMVGAPIASPVTVSGCVVDDSGGPAPNVRMEVEGISYSGTAQATTNAQGRFSLPARQSSRVIVSGRRGAFLTNSVARDVSSSAVDITDCLTVPSANAGTMRLTWGATPSDIDSHLHTPDGAHVYFASKGSLTAAPFASLDVDDLTSFGPEVTTIRRPKVGIYRFYLHNYSRSITSGAPGMTSSPTRLELNYAGRPVVFSPPPGEGSAVWWHVFDLYIANDCTMTLYRYNRWRADEPQNPNATTSQSAATECVPT
jgi:hypothetical protein